MGVTNMDRSELVSAVQRSAGIATHEAAEEAVHATLRVLGERLSGGETKDLAAQLPAAFARDLPAHGAGERFRVDEFYERVADYEPNECTTLEGRRHARAVAAALKVSVTGSEFDRIAAQLPGDYADLLGTWPLPH
jgi:uncharacterized protein (DUF2267 family)